MEGVQIRVLAQFPSGNGKTNPHLSVEILGKPPLAKKITRYLALHAQKMAKIGVKKFDPRKPFSGQFSRGIQKKCFESKFFGKIDF